VRPLGERHERDRPRGQQRSVDPHRERTALRKARSARGVDDEELDRRVEIAAGLLARPAFAAERLGVACTDPERALGARRRARDPGSAAWGGSALDARTAPRYTDRVRPRALALAVLASLAAPIPGYAQSIEGGAARAGDPSWGDYFEPRRRVARRILRQGLNHLLVARRGDGILGPSDDVHLEQALSRFARAHTVLGNDPDLLFLRAMALSEWVVDRDGDGEEERRTEEAIAAFEELREAHPDHHAELVAWHLALLHARTAERDASIVEYRRAIAAWLPRVAPLHYIPTPAEDELELLYHPPGLGSLYLNLAEMRMLTGDLAGAVADYRRAHDISPDDPITSVLSLWGLAVALERSGEHREAIAAAQRAIAADPTAAIPRIRFDHSLYGPMAILHSPRIAFFEPRHELHAYDAIGWEALARQATIPESRQDLLRRARQSWNLFLTDGGNAERFADHARRAAARLDAEIGSR
jgi:tetratricopeptide (TPR) repeat protein